MSMSHERALELNAVERYLLKELEPEEVELFEEHYFSCSSCLDQLESIRSLAEGLSAARENGDLNRFLDDSNVADIKSKNERLQNQSISGNHKSNRKFRPIGSKGYALAASTAIVGLLVGQLMSRPSDILDLELANINTLYEVRSGSNQDINVISLSQSQGHIVLIVPLGPKVDSAYDVSIFRKKGTKESLVAKIENTLTNEDTELAILLPSDVALPGEYRVLATPYSDQKTFNSNEISFRISN